MPQYEVRFAETVQAPREKVFDFFADHTQFTRLFGSGCTRVKDGSDEPNGLGSVRRIGPGPFSFDETIVTFDKPSKLEYQVTRGSPLKNHLGTIDFRAVGETTQIDYVIRFDTKIPGTGGLIGWLLRMGWKQNAPRVLARIASQ